MAGVPLSRDNSNNKKNKSGGDLKNETCFRAMASKRAFKNQFKKIEAHDGIQAVIDSIPAYVIILDDHHRIYAANKALRDALGDIEENILGSYCPKLIHDLNKPFKGCPLEEAKASNKSVEVEMFDEKSARWLRSAVYPMNMMTDEGRNLYLHTVFDINDEKTAKEEQVKLGKQIQLLLDSTDEGIYGIDNKGNCVFANKASERLTGYSVEEIFNKNIHNLIHCKRSDGTSYDKKDCRLNQEISNGKGVRVDDEVFLKKDGDMFPVEYSANPIVKNGKTEGAVITFTDISERKRMEDELRAGEERFRAIVEQSKDGIIMESQDGEIVLYNNSARRIFGYSLEEVNDKGLFTSIIPNEKERKEIVTKLLDALEGKTPYIDIRFAKKDKTKGWASFSVTPLRIGDTTFNLAIVTDITSRKEAEEMINYMAYYDVVTGLPNKTLLSDRLSLAIAGARQDGKPLAVLYFGLDGFKTIVDTFGHDLGDELQREAVHRMARLFTDEKTLACLGNGEFVILMPSIDHTEEPARLAAVVNEALKPVFEFGEHEIHLSASFGISLCPEDGHDSQGLIKNADTAFNRAKEKGNSSFEFYELSMNIRSTKRLSMEGKLYKALDNNEFLLYYQPQVDIRTNRITGLEALIRWQSPEIGFISPLEFIGIAEDVGLIIPMGEWVLQTACGQNKEWQLKGFPSMQIGVNISARQFKQKSLTDDVERILKSTKLDPAYLELEITESVMMEETHTAIETLNRFKKLGIKIAVDDFGTGYSSLAYLKRFPINRIKIDKLFIDTLSLSTSDKAIAQSIISVAHALGLSVIAEGVEKDEQLEILRSLKCDEIQGFLFSKPLPATGIETLLLNNTRICA